MPKYESVSLPTVLIGNKQFLPLIDIYNNSWIKDFIDRFPNCFDRDAAAIEGRFGYYFYPEGKRSKHNVLYRSYVHW